LTSYDSDFPDRTQIFRLEVLDIVQYESFRWRFTPRATLELEGAVNTFNVKTFTQNIIANWNASIGWESFSDVVDVDAVAPGTRKLTVNIRNWAYTVENQSNYPLAGYARWYLSLQVFTDGAWVTANSTGRQGTNYTSLGARNPGPINTTFETDEYTSDITHFRTRMVTDSKEHRTKGFITNVGATTPGGYHNHWITSFVSDSVDAQKLADGTVNWIAIGS
jgi:hypothetical protein